MRENKGVPAAEIAAKSFMLALSAFDD